MAENQVVTKPAGRALLTAVESAQLRKGLPEIKSGDTVRLQVKVVEGNRERLQPFEGVVMRLRGGGVNRNFTVRFKDMTVEESRPLLNFLFEHAVRPEFTCRFRWEANSIAFWDNRCVQHHAMWDYWPHTRSGNRVTVKGTRPV